MSAENTLVVIFLRGGLDGLSAVAPVLDDDYRRARPSLALPEKGLPMLDDRFALHADLAALRPLWDGGRLAVVHAVGSDDSTRSHFEAQDQMEHGASETAPLAGGWIARWLRATNASGALSAIAFGTGIPESLRGAPSACAVGSLADLDLATRSGHAKEFSAAIAALHAGEAPGDASRPVRGAARAALDLVARIEDLRNDDGSGSGYPRTDLGRALAQTARLVRKDVGLRVACIDHGGFDTHFGQAAVLGPNLRELAEALAAFDADLAATLGSARDRVTTVCITEFGRPLAENNSLGTDHGRGSVAFALGGGVRGGGRVLGRWPGLREADLVEERDLQVTTDYRNLLWEALGSRFGATRPETVFPGLAHRPVGVW